MRDQHWPRRVALALLSASLAFADDTVRDNNAKCSCYSVESSRQTEYFSNHRFYDFRYLANSVNASLTYGGSNAYSVPPPVVTNSSATTNTQLVLQNKPFADDWELQEWSTAAHGDSPVAMYNKLSNVYLRSTTPSDLGTDDASATTYLALRTQRQPSFQTSAEMENTRKNVMYASIRFMARVRGAAGACAGMFTFVDNNNEADVEILTRDDHGTIRYTNQPSLDKGGDEVPGASIQKNRQPSWTEWHEHRIDWTKEITRSYLDGVLIAENKVNVPRKPSFVDLNMWSDGGEWAGKMAVNGTAELQIQWVQMVFNTSGPYNGKGKSKRDAAQHLYKRKSKPCTTVCVVDKTSIQGTPEITFSSRSPGSPRPMTGIVFGLVCSVFMLVFA